MDEPAGTVTLAGTNAGEPSVHSSTSIPPARAGAVSRTLPVADTPPTTATASTDTDAILTSAPGIMVSEPLLLEPRYAAVIVTGVSRETAVVVAANVAILLPAGTATEAGTATAELSLTSKTVMPPEGAAALSVTTPVAGAPPETAAG